jgi:hypothetical protein
MMEDARVKLNPGLPWQNCVQQVEENSFPANWSEI